MTTDRQCPACHHLGWQHPDRRDVPQLPCMGLNPQGRPCTCRYTRQAVRGER